LRQNGERKAQESKQVAAALGAAIAAGVPAVLQSLIAGYHPIDIAIAMRDLNRQQREAVFVLLSPEDSGVVLEEVDDEVAVELAEGTDDQAMARIIDLVPPDVGADLLNLLGHDQMHRILERIPDQYSAELEQLSGHAAETAGGLMTSEVVHAPMDVTAGDVIAHIKTQRIPPESLLYIYVIDEHRALCGVVDMAELVTAPPEQQLGEFMVGDVVAVTPETHQSEAVRLVDQYDLRALPVVNEVGQLLGQVTFDDIIDALQDEHTEDIARFAGTSPKDRLAQSSLQVTWLRLPWLAVCFAGTLISASVITSFEDLLKAYVELTAFIPVIAATSGNAGLQSATIMVRALSLGYVQSKNVVRMMLRQAITGLVLALLTAITAGVAGHLLLGTWEMGVVVGLAMLCAVTWASILGAIVPLFFNRIGIDPAVASGPLVSTANDAVAILIYLGLAAVLLRLWM